MCHFQNIQLHSDLHTFNIDTHQLQLQIYKVLCRELYFSIWYALSAHIEFK